MRAPRRRGRGILAQQPGDGRMAHPKRTAMTHAGALIALHAAVALFAMAGLFGKWLALSALAIVLGRTLVAAVALALAAAWRREALGGTSAALVVNGAILALHW